MALMESFNADIHDNVFENCKYGIRLSLGSGENQIYDNTFTTFSQCTPSLRSSFISPRFLDQCSCRNGSVGSLCRDARWVMFPLPKPRERVRTSYLLVPSGLSGLAYHFLTG